MADEVFRARFSCGENLAKHSSPENARGALVFPMPFETDDVLALRWERITSFVCADEDFLYRWGMHHAGDAARGHYLGCFFLNGEELERASLDGAAVEGYSACRVGPQGDEGRTHTACFDGEGGFNCTGLVRQASAAGRFAVETPAREIVHVRDGEEGLSSLFWSSHGGARWALELQRQKFSVDRRCDVHLTMIATFLFDFFEGVVTCQHIYTPQEL